MNDNNGMEKAEGLDYLGIFRQLNERKIKYIICGGVAVNLWGIPRMTYDIDLLLDMEMANLEKFLALMRDWGFKPKIPVEIRDFLDEKKRRKWIKEKNMVAFSLSNPQWAISEIDVLIGTSLSYQEALKNMIHKTVGNVKIPLISSRDLVKMKRNSGRRRDEADARYLETLLEQTDGKDRI